MLYCTKRSAVARGIDAIRKSRGDMSSTAGMLRMKTTTRKISTSGAQNKITYGWLI